MMWSKAKYLFLTLSFFGIYSIYGQDSLKEKRIKVLPVPCFGYSPETSYSIGAVALFTLDFYQDSLTRKSNAKAAVNYTKFRQLIVEASWNYFTRAEKWFTNGLLHYSRYTDLYYGIGPATLASDETRFQSDRIRLDINLAKQIRPSVFLGGGMRYFNYFNLSGDDLTQFPDLKKTSNLGIKLRGFKDTRNNILTSTKGLFMELTTEVNFSERVYSRTTFDFRKYYALGKTEQHVLAGRFYQSAVFGQVPFYDYSLLGGDQFVRGYFFGRFRDQHLSTVQVEYRSPYLWRLSAAIFGGGSMVYGRGSQFTAELFKPNLGAGLRILFDKKEGTNLRLDYAIGQGGQNGFYVSFGESF